jgi:hypothetical protein
MLICPYICVLLVLRYLIHELYVRRGLELLFVLFVEYPSSCLDLASLMDLEGEEQLEKQAVFYLYIFFYFFYQHAGFLFPERREGPEAMFTPPQTQPLQNYPASVRTEHRDREAQASVPPDEALMRLVVASI